jgi:hypothetical protein
MAGPITTINLALASSTSFSPLPPPPRSTADKLRARQALLAIANKHDQQQDARESSSSSSEDENCLLTPSASITHLGNRSKNSFLFSESVESLSLVKPPPRPVLRESSRPSHQLRPIVLTSFDRAPVHSQTNVTALISPGEPGRQPPPKKLRDWNRLWTSLAGSKSRSTGTARITT